MAMFTNLGQTLSLLRELRGQSQARVAREAGIGKSQLSKYENGKELPKLDSLEKVLNALDVGYFEFFYTQFIVDRRAADLERGDGRPARERTEDPLGEPLFLPSLPNNALLAGSADEAFSRVFSDLLLLYRRIFEQLVLSGRVPDDLPAAVAAPAKRKRSSSQRASASSPPRSASPR